MKANITKHVESSHIYIQFSNKLRVDEIPDDVIITMLNNVENMMLIIHGNNDFIIIRRVSDNNILKSIITNDNKQ